MKRTPINSMIGQKDVGLRVTQAFLRSFGFCLRRIFTRAVKQSSVRRECKTNPHDFFLPFALGFVNFLMNFAI